MGDPKDLEMRIKKIEGLLEKMVAKREAVDVSADEVKAYKKVRDLVAWDPDNTCGINECQPCVILRCIKDPISLCACIKCAPCDVECSCGPCNMCGYGTLGSSGSSKFGGLGR